MHQNASFEPSTIKIGAVLQSVERWKKKKHISIYINFFRYISRMWGDSPNKPIATKFRSSVELADVINRAKFHLDQSRGFACGKSQNLVVYL